MKVCRVVCELLHSHCPFCSTQEVESGPCLRSAAALVAKCCLGVCVCVCVCVCFRTVCTFGSVKYGESWLPGTQYVCVCVCNLSRPSVASVSLLRLHTQYQR